MINFCRIYTLLKKSDCMFTPSVEPGGNRPCKKITASEWVASVFSDNQSENVNEHLIPYNLFHLKVAKFNRFRDNCSFVIAV